MGTTEVALFRCVDAGQWTETVLPDAPSVADLDSRVKRESIRGAGRAVGAFVEDSDYAYFVAAENRRVVSRAIVDPDAASDYRQGRFALERVDPELASGSFKAFVKLMAEWKESETPRLKDADLRPEYAEDSISLVSSLLEALTDRPGPPSIPGSKGLLLGKTTVGKKTIDLAELRFVAGYGDGFIGVWDRCSPDEPIRRYSLSEPARAVEDAIQLSLP